MHLSTGWIKIRTALSTPTDLVADQVELAWLSHYPLLNKVILDRGNEFQAEFREIIINDYSIMV